MRVCALHPVTFRMSGENALSLGVKSAAGAALAEEERLARAGSHLPQDSAEAMHLLGKDDGAVDSGVKSDFQAGERRDSLLGDEDLALFITSTDATAPDAASKSL